MAPIFYKRIVLRFSSAALPFWNLSIVRICIPKVPRRLVVVLKEEATFWLEERASFFSFAHGMYHYLEDQRSAKSPSDARRAENARSDRRAKRKKNKRTQVKKNRKINILEQSCNCNIPLHWITNVTLYFHNVKNTKKQRSWRSKPKGEFAPLRTACCPWRIDGAHSTLTYINTPGRRVRLGRAELSKSPRVIFLVVAISPAHFLIHIIVYCGSLSLKLAIYIYVQHGWSSLGPRGLSRPSRLFILPHNWLSLIILTLSLNTLVANRYSTLVGYHSDSRRDHEADSSYP